MDLKDLVKGLLTELNKVSTSEAVVGTVRDAGKTKILPLSKVSIGFAVATAGAGAKAAREGGASDAGAEGGGVAGAVVAEPRAFIVVDEAGVPHMLALQKGKTGVLRRGIEILPEAADRAKLAGAVAGSLTDGSSPPEK